MKLFLATVLILMLLYLSTGAETSDNRASRSATELRDMLLRPKRCQTQYENCWKNSQCCEELCCTGPSYCDYTIGRCDMGK
uniref:Ctr_9_T conopeptide n=2 Tax=Conus tribblei TaxID=101761 RepID=A0A0C9S5V4_CONTD